MDQHPWLALPNDPDTDICNYYEFLLVGPIVFDDHLVVILQMPLVDISLIMNVYKVNNLPVLHSILKKPFQYFL